MPKLAEKRRSRRSDTMLAGAMNVIDQRACSWRRLSQNGHWRAVGVGAGGERGADPEAGAGQWAARDAAVVLEWTKGIRAGRRSCLGGGETQ
jgi:hypothetical protein